MRALKVEGGGGRKNVQGKVFREKGVEWLRCGC